MPLFVLVGVVYERCVFTGKCGGVRQECALPLSDCRVFDFFFATDSQNSAADFQNSAALFGNSAALSQCNSQKMGSKHRRRGQPISKICCACLLLIMAIPGNFSKISAGILCITYGFTQICLAVKLFHVTFAHIARRMAAAKSRARYIVPCFSVFGAHTAVP